ncbi:hypothetical protein HCN44_000776 [Aphidius gifuensis]|uniref:Dolichyl-diphosphooligosaccharide--protein glycosyltransferase subunit 1 n=2 Tax=Aphidius gifuensis TaxID=684658 RepID=A0A834XQC9_APHGI|nr:hypothetical protein HCN44_000776 [Aphidius gifuensis]
MIIVFLAIISINYISAAENNQKNDVVFDKVDRTIDLSSQIAKTTIKLQITNPGKSSINDFIFTIDKLKQKNLSFIKASLSGTKKTKLDVVEVENNNEKSYKIIFKKPLEAGGMTKIEIETSSTHEMVPFPKEITQREKQLVKFTDNVYLYTPYVVKKQTTKVLLATKNIRSYSKIKSHSLKESTVTYDIVDATNGFSKEEFTVHFENNNKFLTVTRLERLIEVSHWGNIAVEETIELLHTGALLKGSFSRYEYSMQHGSGQSSVQNFDTILPAAASDVYYRDDIGNISTSNTRVKRNSVDVNLRPRFPLFGGWKTKYTLGYNVPSYEYLYHENDEYVLNMRLVDHVFDNMVIDELVVKIILPEGSKNFKLSTPYDVVQLPDTLHYSYLDTAGRPVISMTKTNLVESHIQNFKLKYNFPKMMMFQEPLLVVAAFYLMFLLVVVYVRLDFSIDKKEDKHVEEKKTVGKKNE